MGVAALVTAAAGAFLLASGFTVLVRWGGRDRVRRVAVTGVKVRQVGMTRPVRLEFDYPGPDGRPLRAQAFAPVSVQGVGAGLTARGGALTVYVNPDDPTDVVLGPDGTSKRAPRLLGVVLLFLGVVALIAAAVLGSMTWLDGLGA